MRDAPCASRPTWPTGAIVAVGGNSVFVQRSTDRGRTWDRRDWTVPGMTNLAPHPRYPNRGRLSNGAILVSMNDVSYSEDSAGWRNFVWRSTDEGRSWSLHPMGTHSTGMKTNETTVIEASPGRVLALQRPEREPQNLLERWSYDGGRNLVGGPAHRHMGLPCRPYEAAGWTHPLLVRLSPGP